MADPALMHETNVRRVCLSWRQWRAAAEAMGILARQQKSRQGSMIYTTADQVSIVAEVSVTTARRALRELRRVGLLRSHPPSGNRPEMFMPAMWP